MEKVALNETSSNKFFLDLAAIFVQAGVPLQKESHPAMKSFLPKHTKNVLLVRAHFEKTTLGQSMTQHNLKLKK